MTKSKKMELAEEFERRCKRLFDPNGISDEGWRVIAVTRLGLDRSTISRYATGDRPVPDAIWKHIESLETIDLAIGTLRRMS